VLGWPWAFFLMAFAAAPAALLAPWVLPADAAARGGGSLDLAGALVGTAAPTLLVYGLTRATADGFAAPAVLLALGAALALGVVFCLIEQRAANPLVPLGIFRRRTLTGANLAMFAFGAGTNTPIFFFALYTQGVRGYTAAETGLAFLPTNVAMVGGAALGTRLANRIGHRRTTAVGLGLAACGLLAFGQLSGQGAYVAELLPGLVLYGLGIGVSYVAISLAGVEGIAAEHHGLASGLLNTSQEIGTAVGLAALVAIAAAGAGTVGDGFETSPAALVAGYRWAFNAAALFSALGVAAALLLIRSGIAEGATTA
jgi:predicted MFS family arabinose efflux permease